MKLKFVKQICIILAINSAEGTADLTIHNPHEAINNPINTDIPQILSGHEDNIRTENENLLNYFNLVFKNS